jgi:hypothetical protein
MIDLSPDHLMHLKPEDMEGLYRECEARVQAEIDRHEAFSTEVEAFAFLRDHLPSGRLLLYGAKLHSMRLLPALEEVEGVTILGLIDQRHVVIKEVMGYPVYGPDDVGRIDFDAILVANPRFETEMVAALVQRGVSTSKILTLYSNSEYRVQSRRRFEDSLDLASLRNVEFVIFDGMSGVLSTEELSRCFPPDTTILLRHYHTRPSLVYRTLEVMRPLAHLQHVLKEINPRLVYVRSQYAEHIWTCLARMTLPNTPIVHEVLDYAVLNVTSTIVEHGHLTEDEVRTIRLTELYSLRYASLGLSKWKGPVFNHVLELTAAHYKLLYPWLLPKGVPKSPPPEPPIRLAYAGQFWPSAKQAIFRGEWDYWPLFQEWAVSGAFSIDIFNSVHHFESQDDYFAEFIEGARSDRGLCYHRAYSYTQMILKLRSYHYGLLCTLAPDSRNLGRGESIPARLTGYLNAGIPVVVDDGLSLIADWIQEFHAGVVVPRGNLDAVITAVLNAHKEYPRLREGAHRLHQHMCRENANAIDQLKNLIRASGREKASKD